MTLMRLTQQWFAVAAVVALCLASGSGLRAAPSAEDYTAVNLAIAEGHILPRYRLLARATVALEQDSMAFCSKDTDPTTEPLRARYHDAMDAWMGVQHVRKGPVELFMRNFRLQFWPDRKNSVGKELSRLSNAEDLEARLNDDFARRSVAIQGFPAVERLFFSKSFFSGDDLVQRSRNCSILLAITANFSSISADLVKEWEASLSPPAHSLIGAEGTQIQLAGLHTTLQLISDMKLGFPLGNSLEKAKPRRSESWRSGRSLRNIVLNLEALQALYLGEEGDGLQALLPDSEDSRQLDEAVRDGFSRALALAAAIDVSLGQAVEEPATRQQVEELQDAVTKLRQIVADPLSAALGLQLGFNELDGD